MIAALAGGVAAGLVAQRARCGGEEIVFGFLDRGEVLEAGHAGEDVLDEVGDVLLMADAAFDVILCDLQMPQVDGVELFERVRTFAPELAERFVFSTGGGIRPRVQNFIATTKMPILEKPVRFQTLLDAIERVRSR